MSNLRTLPKGDSAWLLRRAIERIIQQVSVLETNIGSSTTGNSANTQVIFNDNGVLRGDVGLAYSSSTAALTIGGNVQAASATITGDLTVDTSTLKVDSANNRVYIGTTAAVLSEKFNVSSSSADTYALMQQGSGITALFGVNATGAYSGSYTNQPYLFLANNIEQYRISPLGVFNWYDGAGGTRMTLNANGLGVGTSPTNKLDVSSSDAAVTLRVNTQNAGASASNYSQIQLSDVGTVRSYWRNVRDGAGTTQFAYNSYLQFLSDAAGTPTERMRIDSSGNVGIGVAPSAWRSTNKAVQVGSYSSLTSSSAGDLQLFNNAYINSGGANIYQSNGFATRYEQYQGVHAWYTAPSGTAGNTISGANDFVQAMTLDASGNLLVGTTNAAANSGSGFKVTQPAAGHFDALIVTSANSSSYSCWDIYSSGGTAGYRFYVTSTGTINAVNTTISAISDARLKENVQDIDVGLGAILALKPRKFDWKEGKGKNIKGDRGFIAQEFEQVFPQLVDEWKDAAPEGETPYKSVRQDLIPVLVKAIQELTARVQTLETR